MDGIKLSVVEFENPVQCTDETTISAVYLKGGEIDVFVDGKQMPIKSEYYI